MRRPLQARSTPQVTTTNTKPVTAPIGGWNTRDSMASMPKTDALVLDNWIVRPGKVSFRKGQKDWVTQAPGAVETLMPWSSGTNARLFAATGTGIFDATTSGVAQSLSSAATSGRWQFTNFSNSVNQWLACVNGVDPYRFYDGTSWTSPATFTYGAGTVASSEFVNIDTYQQRIFLARKGSLDLWYLGIGAIQGEVKSFPLGQLAGLGGYLVDIATWTVDSGQGPDDLLVCVTSEGQAIIYKGIDPTVATSWTLQGVYNLGRPIGRRCLQKYAGDLLYLSDRGLEPLSKVLQSASLDRTTALSDKINTAFSRAATQYADSFGWEICQHSTESFLLINVPSVPPQQFVMDYQSKSWSRFTDHNALCWAFFQGKIFYGSYGKVAQAYVGSSDFGANIHGDLRFAYNYFGSFSGTKALAMVRPSFSSTGAFSYQLNVSTDFDVFGGSSVTQFPNSQQARWDSALWDEAYWTADYYLQNRWETVNCWPFFAMSLGIRIDTMRVVPDLIAVDFAFKTGGGIL